MAWSKTSMYTASSTFMDTSHFSRIAWIKVKWSLASISVGLHACVCLTLIISYPDNYYAINNLCNTV